MMLISYKSDGSWDKKTKCVGASWFLTSSKHHQLPRGGAHFIAKKVLQDGL